MTRLLGEDQAEPKVAAVAVDGPAVAKRRATARRVVAPATATVHAVRSVRIFWIAVSSDAAVVAIPV